MAYSMKEVYQKLYFSLISCFLLAIAFIDFKHFIIAPQLILISACFILVFLIYSKIQINYPISSHLFAMLIGSGFLSIVYLAVYIIFRKKNTIGFGDIQLLLLLGLWLGSIHKILFMIFLSSFIALLY